MQGRARGRKGERKTYRINPYHHITMEFGGYLLNVAKNPTRARARKGEVQGVLSYHKATGIFDNPHNMPTKRPLCLFYQKASGTTVQLDAIGAIR